MPDKKAGFPAGKTKKQAAHDAEMMALKAYEMRVQGYQGREIAEKLDVHRSRVYQLVNSVRDKYDKDRTDLVEIELDRLDLAIKLCIRDLEKQHIEWIEDDDGEKIPDTTKRVDVQVVQTLTKLIDQKAKLAGLHRPVEHKHEHDHKMSIEEIILSSQKAPEVIIDVQANERSEDD